MMIEIVAPEACAMPPYAMDVSAYDFALHGQADAEFVRERARFEAEQSLPVYDNQTCTANRQTADKRLSKLYSFIFREFGLSFEDWVLRLQPMP